ncbi:thiamine pyrophosphate-binding protein [Chromatiales bacterium (ex Bugula neritina AB1)]|nr:thiamine pyrophosphate-binding protein [Chromatiales bacterium (ex Bugula neritina AB1)]
MKSGGELVVDALNKFGVERVFCVPGESYLPVLDALFDSGIETTICRQEGGAAMMAEAWGKTRGVPGVCFVTRGPGATNASAGLHIAAQDSSPMILFVGQIASTSRHREAFQELDYQRFFGGMAKWVAEIDRADRIAEMVSRAWHVASSGRPGPVVVVLPEDTLTDKAEETPLSPWQQTQCWPGDIEVQRFLKMLSTAKKPLAILGGSCWSEKAVLQFTRFAERFELPVACSFRRQNLFDNLHDNYAGDIGLGCNPALLQRVREADVLLLLGGRFAEIPSQDYTLLKIPEPDQQLVHVYPQAEELGKVYKPTLSILASPIAFCEMLDRETPEYRPTWSAAAGDAHRQYLDWSSLDKTLPVAKTMRAVMQHLQETVPVDTIICNGAGNYTGWIHRYWRYRTFGSQLAATSGSMGYGLPAAIAGKLANPEKTVLAFAGDGCFQMTMQEFGTAVQAGAGVIVLLLDNGMYGTIRMHQELHYPGRVSATDLVNPDFSVLAGSYGAFAVTVNNPNEFPDAMAAARAATAESGCPALIHIKIEADALTPTLSLSSINSA